MTVIVISCILPNANKWRLQHSTLHIICLQSIWSVCLFTEMQREKGTQREGKWSLQRGESIWDRWIDRERETERERERGEIQLITREDKARRVTIREREVEYLCCPDGACSLWLFQALFASSPDSRLDRLLIASLPNIMGVPWCSPSILPTKLLSIYNRAGSRVTTVWKGCAQLVIVYLHKVASWFVRDW